MSEGTIKERLMSAMKDAMRSKAKARLTTIRMVQAAIKRVEVDTREDVDDVAAQEIIEKLLKQSRDALAQFEDAGRDDLAQKESADIAVYTEFLPEQLGDAEIASLVDAAIAESGAESPRDMGKVMKVLTPQMKGRADMKAVSAIVKEKLGS